MSKIKITKAALVQDIENGLKRKEIAEKYGVPVTQVSKLIKILGLTGKRASNFMFEIVEEAPTVQEDAENTENLDTIPIEEVWTNEINN